MDNTLIKVIRLLLAELERQEEPEVRVANLEEWKEKVEATWPEVKDAAR